MTGLLGVLRAELLKLRRDAVVPIALGLLASALLLAGIAGGISVRDHRDRIDAQQHGWQAELEKRGAGATSFDTGRHLAPRFTMPGAAGLVLAAHSRPGPDSDVQIGIESRHLDARRTESLDNPLFSAIGRVDLAMAIAWLLPLALVVLCHGLMQEDREAGRWRLVAFQAGRGAAPVAAAIGLRAALVWLVAAGASQVAFSFDAAAEPGVMLAWSVALAGFIGTWALAVWIAQALARSSSGASLGLIGLWVVTTFVLPAAIGSAAMQTNASPSRLVALIEARQIQQKAELDNDELLANWYHEQTATHAPWANRSHAWPVSFVPRYLRIDHELRPLMSAFERAVLEQSRTATRWAWLSPALNLTSTAEALGGVAPQDYVGFLEEVRRREDRWRAAIVPAVMSYRTLGPSELQVLRDIGQPIAPGRPAGLCTEGSWIALFVLAALGFGLRGRFDRG